MKAVKFGQKFICFSFVIEDGKRVVNVSEMCWRLLRLRSYFYFLPFRKVLSYMNTSATVIVGT